MRVTVPVVVDDDRQRLVNDTLAAGVNAIGQFVFFGAGAPTFDPVDAAGAPVPAVYLRTNGGPSSTLYVYDTSTPGWTAK